MADRKVAGDWLFHSVYLLLMNATDEAHSSCVRDSKGASNNHSTPHLSLCSIQLLAGFLILRINATTSWSVGMFSAVYRAAVYTGSRIALRDDISIH